MFNANTQEGSKAVLEVRADWLDYLEETSLRYNPQSARSTFCNVDRLSPVDMPSLSMKGKDGKPITLLSDE